MHKVARRLWRQQRRQRRRGQGVAADALAAAAVLAAVAAARAARDAAAIWIEQWDEPQPAGAELRERPIRRQNWQPPAFTQLRKVERQRQRSWRHAATGAWRRGSRCCRTAGLSRARRGAHSKRRRDRVNHRVSANAKSTCAAAAAARRRAPLALALACATAALAFCDASALVTALAVRAASASASATTLAVRATRALQRARHPARKPLEHSQPRVERLGMPRRRARCGCARTIGPVQVPDAAAATGAVRAAAPCVSHRRYERHARYEQVAAAERQQLHGLGCRQLRRAAAAVSASLCMLLVLLHGCLVGPGCHDFAQHRPYHRGADHASACGARRVEAELNAPWNVQQRHLTLQEGKRGGTQAAGSNRLAGTLTLLLLLLLLLPGLIDRLRLRPCRWRWLARLEEASVCQPRARQQAQHAPQARRAGLVTRVQRRLHVGDQRVGVVRGAADQCAAAACGAGRAGRRCTRDQPVHRVGPRGRHGVERRGVVRAPPPHVGRHAGRHIRRERRGSGAGVGAGVAATDAAPACRRAQRRGRRLRALTRAFRRSTPRRGACKWGQDVAVQVLRRAAATAAAAVGREVELSRHQEWLDAEQAAGRRLMPLPMLHLLLRLQDLCAAGSAARPRGRVRPPTGLAPRRVQPRARRQHAHPHRRRDGELVATNAAGGGGVVLVARTHQPVLARGAVRGVVCTGRGVVCAGRGAVAPHSCTHDAKLQPSHVVAQARRCSGKGRSGGRHPARHRTQKRLAQAGKSATAAAAPDRARLPHCRRPGDAQPLLGGIPGGHRRVPYHLHDG
eukprot:354165-Chlamydomonas_euryale.AAC.5